MLPADETVPPGNSTMLALKLESLITDVERLKRMAKRNLQTASKYHYDALNKRRIEFYLKVKELAANKGSDTA